MIRSLWAYSVLVGATLFFGPIVIVSSLLRLRGGIYNWVARRWSETLLRVSGSRVSAVGLERIDWSQAQVVVCNHIASFDVLALAVTIPVPYHFVAKKELERIPIFGPAWKAAGHISIDRSNRQSAIDSLRRGGEMVRRQGGVIVIFPEGTRSTTGSLQPFKKGAFMLAIECGFPVVPAVVAGSDRVIASGIPLVRGAEIQLHFGDPIGVDGYAPDEVDRLIATTFTAMSRMLSALQVSRD